VTHIDRFSEKRLIIYKN